MRLRRRDGVSILGVMWGVTQHQEAEDLDLAARLEELNEKLEILNIEARVLEGTIAENIAMLLKQNF